MTGIGAEVSPDCEKLVEHLRTVHLSLLAICLILVVAALTQGEPVLEVAHDDLQRIVALQPFLQNEFWLEDYSAQVIATSAVQPELPHRFWRFSMPAGIFATTPEGSYPGKYVAELTGPSWSIATATDTMSFRSIGDFHPIVSLKAPGTLGQWKALWNTLRDRKACIPVWSSDITYVVITRIGPPEKSESISLSLSPSPDIGSASGIKSEELGDADYFLALELEALPRETVWSKSQTQGYMPAYAQFGKKSEVGTGRDSEPRTAPNIRIPVSCKFVDIPAQQYLGRRANKSWSTGDFSQSFQSLGETTDGLDNMPLLDLDKFIEGQLSRSRHDVELLGIKIPMELISRWGLILIVCVQFYYWLNLKWLLHKLTTSSRPGGSAWVGVYDESWAQETFRWSSTLVPIGTIILLTSMWLRVTIKAPSVLGVSSAAFEVLVGVCGIVVAVRTWTCCRRISRAIIPVS